MAYCSQDLMEHIPYVSPLALHGLSMENSAAHYKDALRLRLPFAAYLDPVHAFIRKRNERERHRVRCVNEGYARLREHLPQEFEDKRLSKVETLRAAIEYIKHLQSLLDLNVSGMEKTLGEARKCALLPQRTDCNRDAEPKTGDIGGIVY